MLSLPPLFPVGPREKIVDDFLAGLESQIRQQLELTDPGSPDKEAGLRLFRVQCVQLMYDQFVTYSMRMDDWATFSFADDVTRAALIQRQEELDEERSRIIAKLQSALSL